MPIKEHETIAEMETDKALVEVPSPWTGTVSELCGSAGDIIKVGAVLVRYGNGGSNTDAAAVEASPRPTAAAAEEGRQRGRRHRGRIGLR